MDKFKNRNSQYLNRKILEVKEVTRGEDGELDKLVVDSIRDEGTIYEEGTPLNANTLNSIIREIAYRCIEISKMTDEERATADKGALTIEEQVSSNFTLPTFLEYGSTASWQVVSGSGIVIDGSEATITRTKKDQNATIRATITKGATTLNTDFGLTILKRELSPKERVKEDLEEIKVDSVVSTILYTLPTTVTHGSIITWSALERDWVELEGNQVTITRQLTDFEMIFFVNVKYDNYCETKQFNVISEGIVFSNPGTLDARWTQLKGVLKHKEFTISSNNGEALHIEVDNESDGNITAQIITNNSSTVKVKVSETENLNSLNKNGGCEVFNFKVRVYKGNTNSTSLGTVNGKVFYTYYSISPSD